MGLLQEMTVKYTVDLSELTTGNAQAKNSISSVGEAASSASSIIADSFSTASDAASSFAEMSQMAADNAASALADVGSGAAEADDSLSTLSEEAESAAESMDELGAQAESAGEQVSEATNFDLSGIGNMGSGLLGLGSQIGQTVMGFQVMSNVAENTASALLGPAASAQTVDDSLTNMLGSASAANNEISKLDTLASHSPFETLDIDQAGEQLIGFGISAQNVVPDITAIGDALGAVGRDTPAELDSVDQILGKMTTTGKITEAQMTELGDHGINALQAIAAGAGKSTDQIKQMIKDGTLPATQAIADLTSGIEKNPMLAGGMARAASSFTGELSTLKSNFDQVLADFGSPILTDLDPILSEIGDDLTSPGFKDFAGAMGQKIADLFGSIGKAAKNVNFSQIAQDVQSLGTWFNSTLNPALEGAEPDFSNLASSIGNLGNSVLPPLIKGVGDLAPKVVTVAGDISGGLGTAITTITTNFNSWKPVILTVGGALTAFFIPAIIKSGVESTVASAKMAGGFIVNIAKAGAAGWTSAGQLLSFVGNMVVTGAQAVASGAQVAASWTMNIVASGAKSVVAGGQIVGSFVADMATAGAAAVANGAKVAASWTANVVASGAQSVIAGGKIVGSFIADMAVAGTQSVIAGAKIAGSFIVSLVQAGIQAGVTGAALVADLVPALVETTADALVTAATAIPALVVGFGSWAVSAGIAAVATTALDWPIALIVAGVALLIAGIVLLATHWGQVTSWIGQQMSNLGGLVHNVVGKIGDGFSAFGSLMHNIWNGVANTVKGGINWIIGDINDFIGFIDGIQIHIPSIGVGPVQTPAFNWDGVGIPKIPLLATGGQTGAGWFIAGEQGPELINTNSGATVYNRSQTAAMMSQGGSGGSTTIVIPIYMDSEQIAEYTVDPVTKKVVKKLYDYGPVRAA